MTVLSENEIRFPQNAEYLGRTYWPKKNFLSYTRSWMKTVRFHLLTSVQFTLKAPCVIYPERVKSKRLYNKKKKSEFLERKQNKKCIRSNKTRGARQLFQKSIVRATKNICFAYMSGEFYKIR